MHLLLFWSRIRTETKNMHWNEYPILEVTSQIKSKNTLTCCLWLFDIRGFLQQT